ncbi:hypothetical protein CSHISOI_07823 [Colletotrichum shisoi]|uniref:Uncharacterized protein n=1 Tax=Colletotrichum shisoi TaxID=2078593 RepID=A0A5Q4BLF4_9PEZI|nr:hypothetical protein CSHISOI_07823 [Colletotrichum shisoi]
MLGRPGTKSPGLGLGETGTTPSGSLRAMPLIAVSQCSHSNLRCSVQARGNRRGAEFMVHGR